MWQLPSSILIPLTTAGEAGLNPSSASHRNQILNRSTVYTSQLHLLCSCQVTTNPCQLNSNNWAERSSPLNFVPPGGSKPACGQPVSGLAGGEGRRREGSPGLEPSSTKVGTPEYGSHIP